jgi:hypothetical protein
MDRSMKLLTTAMLERAPASLPITPSGMPDYAPIVQEMKREYSLRVRRWRRQMSGCAWQVRYADGRVVNWIEAPLPKTPISLAIFLHEVGHHAVGFHTYRVRCEEEYHVWVWALRQMRAYGVEPDARVLKRFDRSMQYAVNKALRRGAKRLPAPLHQFLPQAA